MEDPENTIGGFNEETIQSGIELSGGTWLEIENKFEYESYDGSHLSSESADFFPGYLGKRLLMDMQTIARKQ